MHIREERFFVQVQICLVGIDAGRSLNFRKVFHQVGGQDLGCHISHPFNLGGVIEKDTVYPLCIGIVAVVPLLIPDPGEGEDEGSEADGQSHDADDALCLVFQEVPPGYGEIVSDHM